MNSILNGKNLLIVEDEDALREPLVMEFESLGCRVSQANNGKKAFEMVQKENFDVVISDIRMPGGDGVALLKNIKSLHHATPVVMLITGFSDLSIEDAYHIGAEAVLSKPFDLDEIGLAVERILTPMAERLKKDVAPELIKRKIQRTFNSLLDAMKEGQLTLGRGGFYLKEFEAKLMKNEILNFDIRFENGEILVLAGNGTVRWARYDVKSDLHPGYGVEFLSLGEKVREQILNLIENQKLTAYIPRS